MGGANDDILVATEDGGRRQVLHPYLISKGLLIRDSPLSRFKRKLALCKEHHHYSMNGQIKGRLCKSC